MPGCNLATLSPAERMAVSADRVACLIRHKMRMAPKKDQQGIGKAEMAKVPAHLRDAVLERLKARSSA